MERFAPVGTFILLIIFAGTATAQQMASSEETPPAVAHQYSIRAGTFMVELTKPLHADRIQVGEEVMAILEKDLLSNGKTWVPIGSKVVGHVVEARPYDNPEHESRLRILFDKLFSKTGDEINFASPAIVLAVAPDKRVIPEFRSPGRTRTNSAAYGRSTSRAYRCDGSIDQTSFELAVRGSNDASVGSILTPTARGALCMGRLELKDSPAGLIVNKDKSVILEYGTQMVIAIQQETK